MGKQPLRQVPRSSLGDWSVQADGPIRYSCESAVLRCVAGYRAEVRELASTALLARSYQRLDVDHLQQSTTYKSLHAEIKRAAARARRRTSDRALPKLTSERNGKRRIVEDPPLVTRISDADAEELAQGLDEYLGTLAPHGRRALGGYTPVPAGRSAPAGSSPRTSPPTLPHGPASSPLRRRRTPGRRPGHAAPDLAHPCPARPPRPPASPRHQPGLALGATVPHLLAAALRPASTRMTSTSHPSTRKEDHPGAVGAGAAAPAGLPPERARYGRHPGVGQ